MATRALLAALLVLPALAAAAPFLIEGRVVGVADGDTIAVLDRDRRQHKIRLAGIDAPEKAQAFGNRSKESLSRLVFDQWVENHCEKRDRYGRAVCKVQRGSVDVNLEQVRSGLAWWYRAYAHEQSPADREAYERAEQVARAARVGLWRDPNPVPPWEWRRRGRNSSEK